MESEVFLPTLSYLEYGNVWTGSRKKVRWRIEPGEGQMTAEVWSGPLCRECSTVSHTARFPVSEDGLEEMHRWLLERSEE